jgi:hypothetical protein
MKKNNIENNNSATTPGTFRAGCTAAGREIASFLEAVKHEVFEEYQTALGANDHLLRLALIEAEALAQQTGFPHLFFPVLATEKASNAARWQYRQEFLLRSHDALAA